MSVDKKFGRFCDECGRTIAKAHRIHDGHDYCSTCYRRVFVQAACTICTKLARVHRLSQLPAQCRTCANANRQCQRCGRAIVKAGMISAGKPVCPSCVPYFKEPNHCAACGNLSTRLSAMPSFGISEKFCDSCRNKLTHKTCSVCHKYRKCAGTSKDGKPFCASCQPGHAFVHTCPGCAASVPGAGRSRCRRCQNRQRLDHEVSLHRAAFEHDWMGELYAQFANWLHERQGQSPACIKTFRSHHPFFERLDLQFASLEAITAATILDCGGVAYLRTHLLATEYLTDALSLPLSEALKTQHVENERIRMKLLENSKKPWGALLKAYASSLAEAKTSVRTIRLYLTTAQSFCDFAKVADHAWEKAAMLQFLKRNRGARANLSRFVSYCGKVNGWDVAMPSKNELPKQVATPKTVLELRQLFKKVAQTGVAKASRRDLARIIAKSLGLQIGVVMRLPASTCQLDEKEPVLSVGGEALTVPPMLAPIVRQFFLESGGQSPGS